jgi:chromosomal replication initiator protein
MKPEIILEEKAKKHFCYFDTIQTKAIIEAMRTYAYLFKTEEKTDKANFIINEIGRHYGLSTDYFKIKSRKQDLIKARQIAMYFIRSYTKFSLEGIGKLFNKDHATVLNAIRNVTNYIETDKIYKNELINLKLMFDEKLETLF